MKEGLNLILVSFLQLFESKLFTLKMKESIDVGVILESQDHKISFST